MAKVYSFVNSLNGFQVCSFTLLYRYGESETIINHLSQVVGGEFFVDLKFQKM